MSGDHDTHDHREHDGGQFHFDPATYLEHVRAEVPSYEEVQAVVQRTVEGRTVADVLELGVGTGETTKRVLAAHPTARVIGLDESEAMLALARDQVPVADLRVGRIEDALPDGLFDLVVSAFAVHHLDAARKRELFGRIAAAMRPGGRFVLADVVIPDDPADAVTPVEAPHDKPSRLDDQLEWLSAADLVPSVEWQQRDLAVVVADKASGT
jgi:tRNA (cmo5U34)-methyltransferase